MIVVRAAVGVLAFLILTACAGEQLSLDSSSATPIPGDSSIPGRWILSIPNAPSCGLEFAGAPGVRTGKIAPDGGCPSTFYMSRRWAMEGDALTITDLERRPLARFKANGPRFEGQSSDGIPVTLAR
jgi:hypothetical protein